MINYLRLTSFTTLCKITILAAIVLLNACGDASKGGGQTPQTPQTPKTPQSSGGDPPSPTNLASFAEIAVSGAIEGVQTTTSKQDQDAFFAKNSKSALKACLIDKLKNDPKFELEKKWGNPSMDQYMGKLTDENPIFEVIKKYGVKELNQQTKMAYELWVYKTGEAFLACVVQ